MVRKSYISMNAQTVLNNTRNMLRNLFGDKSVVKLAYKACEGVSAFSTGFRTLDESLGDGLLRGSIVELYGHESSGKTSLALKIACDVQHRGGFAAFIDVENTLNFKHATNMGIDVDKLLVVHPTSAEEALEVAERLIESDEVQVVIIDSVAALITRLELSQALEEMNGACICEFMSHALRRLASRLMRHKALLVLINQLRDKELFDVGHNETTPGGVDIKLHANYRIKLTRIEDMKVSGEVVGGRVKMNIIKSPGGTKRGAMVAEMRFCPLYPPENLV